MEDKIVYKCEGTCNGVAHAPGTCQAENCTHFGKLLIKHVQCEDCVEKSRQVEDPQGCDCCEVAE